MMVGLGVQGLATVVKGVAAKKHGEAVQAEDFRSADAAERAASDATYRGEIKDIQMAMQGSRVVAAQRVIQSGTGADVNIGAPKATQEATEAVVAADRKMVIYNAAMQGYGLRMRARGFRQAGVNAATEGKNAMIGTFLGGIADMIKQGGKVASDIKPGDEEINSEEQGI